MPLKMNTFLYPKTITESHTRHHAPPLLTVSKKKEYINSASTRREQQETGAASQRYCCQSCWNRSIDNSIIVDLQSCSSSGNDLQSLFHLKMRSNSANITGSIPFVKRTILGIGSLMCPRATFTRLCLFLFLLLVSMILPL